MNPAQLPTASVSELPASDITLVDVREDDEWAAGHAPGAVHIPLGELPSRVDDLPEGQPLYIVCRSGGRSARATAWLNASGWEAVNVGGGMKSWHAEGRPVVSEQPDAAPEIL
ncbi:rhodanese-like domain-containing protein [Amycolatopsis sp. GM8]|uniref:rhodanese-like domain-containing protein n=1 Tax=Amycolatopsis sp. GM8 TaxID=2896530 RepID=UPI001F1ADB4E|nr:rhodanese-like domain-containing protein [Amycolatopsis sp. GM8]